MKLSMDPDEKRGWAIVAYGMLVLMTLNYFVNNGRSIYMLSIVEDLGISRSAFSFAGTINSLIRGAAAFFLGEWLAKKTTNVRLFMTLCIFMTGGLTAVIGFAQNIWQIYILYAVRAFFGVTVFYLGFQMLIRRWLPKSRGRANSLFLIGSSMGGIFMAGPMQTMVTELGWRRSFLFFGGGIALLVAPVAYLVIRDNPAEAAVPVQKAAAPEKFKPLKDKRFLPLIIASGLMYFYGTVLYHISPAIQSMGFSAEFAVKMISLYSIINIGVKYLTGWLCDKKGMLAGVVPAVAGSLLFFVFAFIGSMGGGKLFVILMAAAEAFSICTYGTLNTTMVYQSFSAEEYGVVMGKAVMINSFSASLGELAISLVYDWTGSYAPAWVMCFILAAASLAALLILDSRVKAHRAALPETE